MVVNPNIEIIEVATLVEYYTLSEQLRQLGFVYES